MHHLVKDVKHISNLRANTCDETLTPMETVSGLQSILFWGLGGVTFAGLPINLLHHPGRQLFALKPHESTSIGLQCFMGDPKVPTLPTIYCLD
jgi:hypothetical protein